MTRLCLLLPALMLLSGCESLNGAFVRHMFKDQGLSRQMNKQIREGLERREKLPPAHAPEKLAPSSMDRG